MRCKRIVILSFVALGFAIQGPSAMAQLPVAGALVHLDAALGVNTDFSGNLTLWENQGTGDPYLTDFVPDGGNIGTLPVTPSAFPKGTPGVYFNAARINSQGDWFDPDTGYTIFFVTDSVSDGFSPGGPPGSSGGALLQADCPSCPPQSYSNKVGFDNPADGMGYVTFVRNNGETIGHGGGTSDMDLPHVVVSRLDATLKTLELHVDGGLVVTDTPAIPANYGVVDVPPMETRIGANTQTTSTDIDGYIGEVVIFDFPLNSTDMGLMQTYLDDKHLGPPSPPTNTFKWVGGGLGDWGQSGSWSPVGGPAPPDPRANNANHTAVFPDTLTEPTNVSTMDAVTVNSIEFNTNTASVVVSGLGSVNLASQTESPFDTPTMSVTGTHQFQVNANLLDDTTANVASGSSLEFVNRLNLGGNTLTKTGGGTLLVNNSFNTGGGTIINSGGVVGGGGNVGGNLNNSSGTVAPGNSPGILTIDGNYTQGDTGTLALEIGGLVPGDDHDKLVVMGIADLDGTVAVELTGGFGPSTGDEFDVLDFTSFVNSGYSFDFSLAGVADDWDTSQFNSDGLLCFGACSGGGLTDYDNDGTWGLGDLNLVLFNWNEDGAILPATWTNSRPPGGTLVGLPELNQVLFNWGQPGSLAAVPEPGSLLLLVVGCLATMCRRKRPS